ncbi:MAG: hypothetical protein EON58_03220 [Alphaproteobacteria bacterium]|nr:MAG: hypothetical protein EON58_03220 [Alphaproteobacteria bacterium]
MNDTRKSQDLVELFGIYRAEWLSDALFRLFSKPSYFPELETPRPCVLVGGRGTGKTTVLRCLSYEGRFALMGDTAKVCDWPYFGFYYKVNTNSVRAFQGDELSQRQWQKLFAHYLNLIFSGRVVEFLQWHESVEPNGTSLDSQLCSDLATSLFCDPASTQEELLSSIQRGVRRFEAWVNNIDPDNLPGLSMQGVVIDDLCKGVLELPQFKDKRLFFIIDEFENLLDDQQEVVNTLVKHCGPDYTFKIGVRELGWRRRSTLHNNEQLQSPADYERIDIQLRLDGDQFAKFAKEVCSLRAAERFPDGFDLESMLPSLSVEDEAKLLGVDAKARATLDAIEREAPDCVKLIENATPLELALIQYWSRTQRLSLAEVIEERQREPAVWRERYHNYRVPLLFTLRGARPGVRKYYAGWRTFTLLAGNNIRYLLQLVGEALLLQRQDGKPADGEPIRPVVQTNAAISVGGKNVKELEGLGVHGAQLTRLVLSLGRLFEMLALEPEGRRPEITRFAFPEDEPLGAVEPLLQAAVMHLALTRRVSSQRTDLDLKSYDYAVHPIFAAFFGFSHRDMRKIRLTPSDIMQLMQDPKRAIRQIMGTTERSNDAPLPDQLRLFENFYGRD